MPPPKASLIISIYKNIDALRVIFYALELQSEPDFEVIISEDGQDNKVKKFLDEQTLANKRITHLTQTDIGFTKNKALNHAVSGAVSNYVIFIDGDCVPHKHFIKHHIQNAQPKFVCSGRRAELGPVFSKLITKHLGIYKLICNSIFYVCLSLPAKIDHAKNFEAGLCSKLLHKTTFKKPTRILGCNFSCFKDDLININGFNEDYTSPGIGEDTDIDWRLRQTNVKIKNIKFLSPVYHLYHQHKFQASTRNRQLFDNTIATKKIVCKHGIRQYLPQNKG